MSHTPSSYLSSACALTALLWLAACSDAPAQQSSAAAAYESQATETFTKDSASVDEDTALDDDGSFEVASVPDPELADMRGGFLLAGGFRLDFGLTTVTQVNGAIVSSLSLSSSKLNGNLPQNLQQIVQVGNGNNFNTPSSATTTNTILTLVQNSTNNAVISNKNTLNLTVSNFAHFNISNATLNSILPLVRALH